MSFGYNLGSGRLDTDCNGPAKRPGPARRVIRLSRRPARADPEKGEIMVYSSPPADKSFSQQSDLEDLIAELEEEIDDRAPSVSGELNPPDPLRGTELYCAVQAVERHYGGKLPMGPWQDCRGMLLRADEGRGEADLNERYEQYYACCDHLRGWVKTEVSRITGENLELLAANKEQSEESGGKHQKKKPKTRKKRSDPKADKTLWEAWNTGRYKNLAMLAAEKDTPKRQVHLAIDRHRKRQAAKGQSRKKSRQE